MAHREGVNRPHGRGRTFPSRSRTSANRLALLKETGLIYSNNGPHQVHVSDDVRFSLRYSDDDHIARELGEPPAAPGDASPW